MAGRSTRGDLDPGAYIGHEPEREADSIPGGVRPDDDRVAAYGSRAGVPGEPDRTSDGDAGDDADLEAKPDDRDRVSDESAGSARR